MSGLSSINSKDNLLNAALNADLNRFNSGLKLFDLLDNERTSQLIYSALLGNGNGNGNGNIENAMISAILKKGSLNPCDFSQILAQTTRNHLNRTDRNRHSQSITTLLERCPIPFSDRIDSMKFCLARGNLQTAVQLLKPNTRSDYVTIAAGIVGIFALAISANQPVRT